MRLFDSDPILKIWVTQTGEKYKKKKKELRDGIDWQKEKQNIPSLIFYNWKY